MKKRTERKIIGITLTWAIFFALIKLIGDISHLFVVKMLLDYDKEITKLYLFLVTLSYGVLCYGSMLIVLVSAIILTYQIVKD